MMLEVLWLTPEHEDTTGPETVSSELQKDDEFMESLIQIALPLLKLNFFEFYLCCHTNASWSSHSGSVIVDTFKRHK